ncbi:MAG TPA: hypothetical protein VF897_13670, partial [Roseiflexaceae bacterium]
MVIVTALSMVWLWLTFLYGQSYLPGAIILTATYWFVLRRRQSSALFVLAVLGTLLLVNLYFYDLIQPAHYPLTFSIAHLVLTLALFAALSGVSSLAAHHAARESRRRDYAHALGTVTSVVGVAALLGLSSRDGWEGLAAAYDGSTIGFMIGGALLLAVAIPVFTRPVAGSARTVFLGWACGWLLLVGGLADQPSGLRTVLPLIAVLFAFGVAGGLLVAGVRRLRLVRLSAGLAVLALAALVLAMEWSTHYLSIALVAFGAASVVFVVAHWYWRGAEPARVTQPAELLGVMPGETSQGV